MLVVHATRALRERLPGSPAAEHDVSSTVLGAWYATGLRWRRPAALLVNRTTLLPLLLPLAPAATLLARLPDAVTELLHQHHVPAAVINTERMAMAEVRVAPTADRSTVGILNEFARLADWHRSDAKTDTDDLLQLSLRLARTPLGPLYRRHGSPDRELAALIDRHLHDPFEDPDLLGMGRDGTEQPLRRPDGGYLSVRGHRGNHGRGGNPPQDGEKGP